MYHVLQAGPPLARSAPLMLLSTEPLTSTFYDKRHGADPGAAARAREYTMRVRPPIVADVVLVRGNTVC